MRQESLYINEIPAWSRGIAMGDNFLTTLERPLEMKEFIRNESRLEDGARFIPVNPRVKYRSLTLTFYIHGTTPAKYAENKKWLEEQLYKGLVDIKTNTYTGSTTYHLLYTGKSITYDIGGRFTDGKMTVGFDEPNPRKRD
ncbi:MAG: hypothetical protein KBT34_05410 [Prevotella sp.]|nr:hypothetical protein [Candidatus Prevotella equi]